MEVSEKEKNLANTLREQARAEEGMIVDDFTEFEKLVCAQKRLSKTYHILYPLKNGLE